MMNYAPGKIEAEMDVQENIKYLSSKEKETVASLWHFTMYLIIAYILAKQFF